MKKTLWFATAARVLGVLLCAVMSSTSFAYSYAAAGKEPVIDGREAILSALAEQDFDAVQIAVSGLSEEFAYLQSDHDVDLKTPMQAAIQTKDAEQIEHLMDQMVIEEIVRRLDGASKNLSDYQVAKVLVVKSKLFLDLIAPKLAEPERQNAQQAIQGVLAAIGNPGVFGVGQAPADPEAFSKQRAALLSAIKSLK